ncbi:MAG: glycosyltransferase family 9 protein [Terricaulis sp.]
MMPWRKPVSSKADDANAPKSVLVIQLGNVAEFITALAAAKRIRDAHVGARITLLTTEMTGEIAEKCPYFDTVEANGKPKEPRAITQLIAHIRAAHYDMIYDLEGSSRTSSYFQGLRPWPPKWSGPVAGASHSSLDATRGDLHPLDRLGIQLAVAGVPGADQLVGDLGWVRAILRDPPRLQPDYFGLRGPYVVLLPRGGAEGARHWPDKKYLELARRLTHSGVTPVVLGGSDERGIGASLAKDEPRVKNLVTRADLFQTIGLCERASFVVGDDVDTMWVAAAAGAPCLVFLSAPQTADLSAPRGKGGVVAFTAADLAELPVDQVVRQLRNCGVIQHAATA